MGSRAMHYRVGLDVEDGHLVLHVSDRHGQGCLACWRDAAARALLATGVLPRPLAPGATLACDKTRVWHLFLAAAAQRMAAEDAGLGRQVLDLFAAHRGEHLRQDDLATLLLLQGVPVDDAALAAALDAAVARGCLQAIDVAGVGRFYDADTRPHAHLYDPDTGELSDADIHGVLALRAGELPPLPDGLAVAVR